MPSKWSTRTAKISLITLNLASIVERVDEQVLPAVYLFLGTSFKASLQDLGTLTLCRALVQALSSPVSGVLGDRYDRTLVVAAGCCLWGVMTSALGLATSLHQAMIACALNGFGLSLVVPAIASLVADTSTIQSRGRAFGLLGMTSSLGAMIGALYATNIGGTQVLGIAGWRFAFHSVGALSLFTAWLVKRCSYDPRSAIVARDDSRSDVIEAQSLQMKYVPSEVTKFRTFWHNLWAVLRIPSFQVLVLQGVVGSMPWQAMVMFTLWLQLVGFSDLQSSVLMAIFTAGTAVGGLLGGWLGDMANCRYPRWGRIAVAQFSVLSGLPLSFLILKALPEAVVAGGGGGGEGSGEIQSSVLPAVAFGTLLFVFGASISWCGCNNSAIFAEIVPKDSRTQVYAFDRSFEGAIGACGAPLVGLTAEKLFGFRGSLDNYSSIDQRRLAANSLAGALLVCLGKAAEYVLLGFHCFLYVSIDNIDSLYLNLFQNKNSVAPWTLCFLSYSVLYYTLTSDKIKALKTGLKEVRV